MRIFEKVRGIYQLYGTTTNLALTIASGPHMETPELQLAVLRWFNRFLKREEPPIEISAKSFFPREQLKVFETLPADNINSNIADSFVPLAKPETKSADELRAELREKVFSGWPDDNLPPEAKQIFSVQRDNVRFSAWDFTSQHDVSLRIYLLENVSAKPEQVSLQVLNQSAWTNWLPIIKSFWNGQAENGNVIAGEFADETISANAAAFEQSKSKLSDGKTALAFFAPRGVGLTAFSGDDKQLTKIRRRFMLLGQTLDGMRVWDIRRAVQLIQSETSPAKIELDADGNEAMNALYAALFETSVKKIDLANLPESQKTDGSDYLGVLKFTDIPQIAGAVASQTELKIAAR